MRSIKVHVLALAALLACRAAFAASYYVATTGSDGASGSSSAPWATLQHAVDTIGPGDTIFVQAGSYLGCRIGISGLSTAPKTLQAAPGAHVLLTAPGPANRHNSIVEVENFSGTTSDWIVDGFEIANSPKYAIDIRVTARITVRNNTVHDSALTGIFTAFSNYPLIQNNVSYNNHEHGIYTSNSGDHPTIRGNRIHDNTSAGIHMNGDKSQGGDGIISFATVEKNVIWHNGSGGGSGINCDGVDDSVFRNNLLYNNHASGISLYAIDGAHGSSNNKVYNNTIVMAPNSRFVINIPNDGDGKAPPVGNVVENNILYTPDSFHGSVLIASPSVSGFHSDFNVVVGHFSDDGGDASISLAKWQALGFDLHSILATPAQLFVDPANNNYQLKAGSLAIDKGTSLLDVPVDILGVHRPQGLAWDIGCYEAASTVPLLL